MTKEEKNSLFRIEEKPKKKLKIKQHETDVKQSNITQKLEKTTNINNNNNDITLKGKRKKRINKYKKAIYRYRYQKKKFILENVLNFQENQPELEINIKENYISNKEQTNNTPSIEEIKQTINLNPETNKISSSNEINKGQNNSSLKLENGGQNKINYIKKEFSNVYNNMNGNFNGNMLAPSYNNMNYYPFPFHSANIFPPQNNINYYTNFIHSPVNFINSKFSGFPSYYYPQYQNQINYDNKIVRAPFLNYNYSEIPLQNYITNPTQYYQGPLNARNYIVPNTIIEDKKKFLKAIKKKNKKNIKPNKNQITNVNLLQNNQINRSDNKLFLFEQKLNEE